MDNPALEGTVTILFTDVEGSTDLGSRSGDRVARGIIRSHESIVRTCIAEARGHEIKSLGDGFMVAFSSARRALECAVDIQRAMHAQADSGADAVRVRIGLNAGEVIHEDGDIFGSAVTATARISAHARGGEILVSEVVKALVGNLSDLEFEDRGHVDLKGFTEPWRLFEAKWHKTVVPVRARRTPFIGRENERTEIRAHLDALEEGTGALILIGGEPGVGKTRLAEEVLAEAREREFRSLVGRCYESDAPPPYLPFVEVLEAGAKEVDRETFRLALGDAAGEVAKVMPQLRTLFDDLPAPLEIPPEQERRYLFNSIGEFIARAGANRPLVVLLDDLHWADESSLLLLQHVARGLSEMPVLVVGTYRDSELDAARPLAAAVERLVRERLAQRMPLRRLSVEAIRTMLTRLAGSEPPDALVSAIYSETDGNAFFVEEVYAHLTEEGRLFDESGNWRADLMIDEIEVPEGIRLVVGRRIQRLEPDAQRVLTIAAAVGRDFDFSFLEALDEFDVDVMLDAVESAERAGLVVPTEGTRFTFAHELIRQTLLASVSLPRRQRMHLRIGEAMAKIHASDLGAHAAEIAVHLLQGGAPDTSRTVDLLMLAGDRAIEAAAFEEALRYFEDALSLEPEDLATRADLIYRVGLAQRATQKLDEGVATWRQALDLYDELGDITKEASVIAAIAYQLSWAGRWEEAVELAMRGLQLLGDADVPERARLLSLTGAALGGGELYEAGMQNVTEALELSRRIGSEAEQSFALSSTTIVHWGFNEFEDAVRTSSEAQEILARTGDLWTLANVLSFKVWSLTPLGRVEEALALIPELKALSEKVGHAGGLLVAMRARNAIEPVEHVDDYVERGLADLRLNEENGLPWSSQSQYFIGRAELAGGRVEEGLERIRLSVKTDPPGFTWGYPLGVLFRSLVMVGLRDEASALIDRIRQELPASPSSATVGRAALLRSFAEGLFELDAEDDGLYEPIVEVNAGSVLDFNGRPVETFSGIAAALAGDLAAADRHLDSAGRLCMELRNHVEFAEVRRIKATVAVRRGDEVAARRLFEEASEIHERLGFTFYAGMCAEALHELNS